MKLGRIIAIGVAFVCIIQGISEESALPAQPDGSASGNSGAEDAFRLADADLQEAFIPGIDKLTSVVKNNAGALAAGAAGVGLLAGAVAIASSLGSKGPSKFSTPSDMNLVFKRDHKCVLCEFVLQRVDEELRANADLHFIGTPRDYPYEDTGSIYGASAHLSKLKRGKRKLPTPPSPSFPPDNGGNPLVKPPADRLTPSEVAQGGGAPADAIAAEMAKRAAAAAEALVRAQKSIALPGANGATGSYEGGIRSLTDYSGGAGALLDHANENGGVVPPRPVAMGPVDPNARLIPTTLEGAAFVEMESHAAVDVPDYLTSSFYHPHGYHSVSPPDEAEGDVFLEESVGDDSGFHHFRSELDRLLVPESSAARFLQPNLNMQDPSMPVQANNARRVPASRAAPPVSEATADMIDQTTLAANRLAEQLALLRQSRQMEGHQAPHFADARFRSRRSDPAHSSPFLSTHALRKDLNDVLQQYTSPDADLLTDHVQQQPLPAAAAIPIQNRRRRAPIIPAEHTPSYASRQQVSATEDEYSAVPSRDEDFAREAAAAAMADSAFLETSSGPTAVDEAVMNDMLDSTLREVQESMNVLAKAQAGVDLGSTSRAAAAPHSISSAVLAAEHDLQDAADADHKQELMQTMQDIADRADAATSAQHRFAQAANAEPSLDDVKRMGGAAMDAVGAGVAKGTAKMNDAVAAAVEKGLPVAANAAAAGMRAGAAIAEHGLEAAEKAGRAAKKAMQAAGEKTREFIKAAAPVVKEGLKKAGEAAQKGAVLATSGLNKGFDMLDKWDVTKLVKKQEEFNSWGSHPKPVGRYPERGKFGERERTRRSYRISQQLRYQQLYHAVMRAMEATCKTELPQSMFSQCRPVYAYAERITDWLMHGYYVDEICEKISLCAPGFFDVRAPE